MAVFANGYTLYTNRSWANGVYMNGNTSGWTNISDRNKKENFRPIDGEALLSHIRGIPVTEWNYKNTDPSIKYIGPVAQDFYAAFHLGGTDSLGINSICIDGVNMAAIQALEKRTTELRDKTAELHARTAELETMKSELVDLRTKLARLEDQLATSKDVAARLPNETNPQR
jgi:trimeric autotransporter adhesin